MKSVYVPWCAYKTAYVVLDNAWADDSGWRDELFLSLKEEYPSLNKRRLTYDKGFVLAENKVFLVVVAEHMGLVSVSLVPHEGKAGNLISRFASEEKLYKAVAGLGVPVEPTELLPDGEQLFRVRGNSMFNSYSSEYGWSF